MQRYLLGELPEEEREALEQEYFCDRQLFEQVVRAEHELLDRYARGLLPPPVRERCESHYLAHPVRRERAMFAEALAARLEQTDEVAAAPSARSESLWGRWRASTRGPRLAWALSVALLLAAAGAVWFLSEARQLRQELARAETGRATEVRRGRELEQQAAEERQRVEQLSAELERLRAERPAATPTPTPAPPGAAAPAFVTLALAAGGMRGADAGAPALLVIPAGTEQVRLKLQLRDQGYSSYSAVLQSPGGGEVYAWPRLAPRTASTGARFSLVMPARRLAAGDYILTLRGVGETGEAEDVSKSLFRVERR